MPGMTSEEILNIVVLEDDPGDAALLRRYLGRLTPRADVRWARTREDFVRELDALFPQIVLSDYKLPGFDGLTALALVRERSPETPFILISGTIGEEMAVEALKCGATDYVLKQHLERLDLVLGRALRERREREDRLRAEAALKESQAQLLQSQKMEAMGRLSGGVAHDFNNILTAITGYSELALMNPRLEEGLRADIKEIFNSAFRAAALTKQLLAFSRRQAFAPRILDLNRALAELDRMLQRIIGEDVKLEIVPDPALLRVRADADQLGQVVMNLVVNARDAMPKGGTITLRTENAALDAAALRAQPGLSPGTYVRLCVEDTGEGMDAETMARMFEPFFTTKDKGTGLGLATVYGIVRQSGGFIEADSRPGGGCVFRVHLPALEEPADEARKPAAPRSLDGAETVLVVDDDPSVALVARRILESRGYAVLAARDGEEALRLCADPARAVDLVLSDVVLAGMSGPELARRLKEAHPGRKVLFTSGYAEGGTGEAAETAEPFIPKPFSAADLLHKVRELLDG